MKDFLRPTNCSALTDADGDYSSGVVSAGTCRVFFNNNGLNYVSEWYSDRWTFQTASDVVVLSRSTTSNVNTDLDVEKEVAADIGSLGVWLWDNGVWTQLSGNTRKISSPRHDGAKKMNRDLGDGRN